MVLWLAVIAAAAGCYGLKLAGLSLPDSLVTHPRALRSASLLPVATLSALVVTDLFDNDRHYTADWHTLAGLGAASIALWCKRSLIVVLLIAITTTAALRALA
jgi:branched-subunit amino acid transport protein